MPLKTVLVLCAALVLSGCNTFQGFGRDLSVTGDAIEDSAQDAQRGM